MSESTARAEKFEFRSSVSPSYLWDVPAKPVAVRLSLEVVDRLGREALDSFRSVSSRGSEIGGVLLGSVIAGERPLVMVEGFETVPCEYSRGPLYRLSESDKQRFDQVLKSHEDAGELAVVGFYRSSTRKGLSLDAEDIAFLSARFSDPLSIALIIRPFATKTSVGGIFVWENGTIHGDASPLEFPFSAEELGKLVDAAPAAPAASAPASPKPATRAQIVPIASRREAPAPLEEPLEAPAPPIAKLPAEAHPPVVKATPVRPAAEPEPAAVKPAAPPVLEPEPAPVKPPSPATPEPAAAQAEAAPATVAAPSFGMPVKSGEDRTASEKQGGSRITWILLGVALALVLAAAFVYPGFLRRSSRSAPVAEVAGLALRAERTAGDLLITWNRDSEAVRTAVKGVLTISDGPQQENVALDLAQLRNGSIVYSPATSDVSFRLEVTSSDPSKSQNESLRVLKTKPSALDASAPGAPSAEPLQPPVNAPPEAPVEPKIPARPFNAATLESPATRLRAPSPADLPEPPSAGGSAHISTAPIAGLAHAPVALPAPAPVPPPAGQPKQTPPPARVGGDVKQAVLISRREPVYPPMARQARIGGSVVVEARIGPDGRVIDVKAVDGHPMLRPAVIEAVKKWTYRPAILNGQPIESTSRVEINFIAGR